MPETGTGEVYATVESPEELLAVVHSAYQKALSDAYPDPSDEPGLPVDVTVRTEVTYSG